MQQKLLALIAKWLQRVIEWITAPSEVWLKRMIKIAAVFLTLPATIIVAGQHLYPEQPLLKLISQIAAVILTEATLLLGWNMLDKAVDKQASTAQRWLYTALSLVAYGVLWVVALYHGEGSIGIAFRLTLLVVLVYSVWETGILANLRLQRAANRDIRNHRKVRRAKERAEMRIALLEIKQWEAAEMQRIMPGYKRGNLWTWLATPFANQNVPLVTNEPRAIEPPITYKWTDKSRELAILWKKDPAISNAEAGRQIGLTGERVRQIKEDMKAARIITANGHVELLKPIPEAHHN